jgi:hypothetical protein
VWAANKCVVRQNNPRVSLFTCLRVSVLICEVDLEIGQLRL